VKSWFQAFAVESNLYRYMAARQRSSISAAMMGGGGGMMSPPSPPRGIGLPESGEHLADLDEAQYALTGIAEGQPAAVGLYELNSVYP
jgi:hypothetical protein